MSRKILHTLLLELIPFPTALISVLTDYIRLQWEILPIKILSLPHSYPSGLTTYNNQLYCCDSKKEKIQIWTSHSEQSLLSFPKLPTSYFPSDSLSNSILFTRPYGIEIYDNFFYMIDSYYIWKLNTMGEVLNKWNLPIKRSLGIGLTIDNKYIYFTLSNQQQIFIYDREKGIRIKEFGRNIEGSEPGVFRDPKGLTCDKNNLYVCDYGNHRIQILSKQEGFCHTRWNDDLQHGMGYWFSHVKKENTDLFLRYPHSIYYFLENEKEEKQNYFYIGDSCSVTVVNHNGILVQKLGSRKTGHESGEFNFVIGMVIMNGYLFVSDIYNNRIQIFRSELE